MKNVVIKHHGAVNGVTGSCHELTVGDAGILIDCGLFQGAEVSGTGATAEALEIDFPIAHIHALIVTHVHIDHVGRIPHLLAAGFAGPIYCSEPSAKLLPLVLEDAIKVGLTRDRALVEKFLRVIRQRVRALPYNQWHTVIQWRQDAPYTTPVAVRLQRAGHILGSAYVECDIGGTATDTMRSHRVVFSGDLGAPHAPLLPPPRAPYRADTLVIESTYGDRQHQSRAERRLALKGVIEKALHDRGAVLIPAFSIGRTQEILYELESLIHDFGRQKVHRQAWQELGIIVDSPLASSFTEAYRTLKPYWDDEALTRVRSGRHPLSFEQLLTVSTHEQHQKMVNYVRSTGHPCVVIAASGMCAGGRIVNYLKALIEDPRSDILFMGYQAQGTPGRIIQTYGPKGGYVELDGQRYAIRARIHTVSGYSAHADQADLLNFVRWMKRPPAQIRIVHGDEEAKRVLQRQILHLLPEAEVIIPKE